MLLRELLSETASAGGTSAGNIAAVPNPHIAVGNDSVRKKYGKGGKPKPPTVVQPKNKDGTAKNAIDTDISIFGEGKLLKR